MNSTRTVQTLLGYLPLQALRTTYAEESTIDLRLQSLQNELSYWPTSTTEIYCIYYPRRRCSYGVVTVLFRCSYRARLCDS